MMSVDRLREVRQRAMLSQQSLALAAGVSETTINRLEQGFQKAQYVTVRKLADALGVAPAELLAPPELPGG